MCAADDRRQTFLGGDTEEPLEDDHLQLRHGERVEVEGGFPRETRETQILGIGGVVDLVDERFHATTVVGAVAALREAVSRGRLNMNRFADVLDRCRMLRIVRPYMEGVA